MIGCYNYSYCTAADHHCIVLVSSMQIPLEYLQPHPDSVSDPINHCCKGYGAMVLVVVHVFNELVLPSCAQTFV